MNIGDNLKKFRSEKKLTQKQVSEALGISRSVYSQYENSERDPSLKRLISLARFYMVTLDYLCGNTDRITIDITDLDEIQQKKIFATLREMNLYKINKKDLGEENHLL